MPTQEIYFWKKAPFVRMLISLVIGIIIQWVGQPSIVIWYFVCTASFFCIIGFFYIPLFKRFRFGTLNGIAMLLPFVAIGALLVWHNDVRNSKHWVGNHVKENSALVVTLDETLVEKNKSFKADASVAYLIEENKTIPLKGKIVLYFKKDSVAPPLEYGSQIIFKKPLQEIKNSGNPGGFDYKRYALFHGITHQIYLKPGEFIALKDTKSEWLPSFLKVTREKVLNILRHNIKGSKESGLAEALLIGYKEDLDKSLVQSYTNTGVVHIIAISGLHLGLIYWLLVLLLKPMQRSNYVKWLRPLVIVCGLWIFSLLAGAQPSILRSAVMFTCIVLGENLTKKTSIYNNLALSAFLLLCYNPYWLWDVGFQLSYSAVLSIVVFMKPIYNLLYIKNKLLDFFWKINAVTIAAQILTLPLSIYHFHQFPTHFLLTNFVAVPLSSLILLGEIFLCVISFMPHVALFTGRILSWLIGIMNSYIEKIEALPFSLWDGLQINFIQVVLLFILITGASYWILEKRKTGLRIGLIAMLSFFIARSLSFWEKSKQQKVIVYNVAQSQAIDFINGRRFIFTGDPGLEKNDFARNFHLKPSRTLQRVRQTGFLDGFLRKENYISFCNKNILLLDSSTSYKQLTTRHALDLLVVSKNPRLFPSQLAECFIINQVVFDGSVAAWKLKYWKKECDSLRIPYHDVSEKGAFVMNLN
jgi:competence protein ComEC